ncbi:MAG: hypothetical protein ACRCZP_18940 [Phycicoccus sp.]
MPRIRTIKPEFWSSPDTAACDDPWARLLYVAMWSWADDNGRGTANPKELAGFAFPNDEKIEPGDVRRMLGGIRRAFGVDFYKIGGRLYYSIPSWEKHQKIDKRGQGKHPGPEDGEPWDPDPHNPSDLHRYPDSAGSAEDSGGSAEDAPSPRPILGAGTGEQGNRGTGEQGKKKTAIADAIAPSTAPPSRTSSSPPSRDEAFEAFWAACPRRVGKDAARRAYAKAVRRPGITDTAVLTAMQRAATFWTRTRTEPQFVPHPATWLNQGRYEDPEPDNLPAAVGGTPPPSGRVPTTTQRVADIQALKEHFR